MVRSTRPAIATMVVLLAVAACAGAVVPAPSSAAPCDAGASDCSPHRRPDRNCSRHPRRSPPCLPG